MHQQKMPQLTGIKAYALPATLRDQDDQEEYAPPENGITIEDLDMDELTPHYFYPNYLRPDIPESVLEDGDDLDVSFVK